MTDQRQVRGFLSGLFHKLAEELLPRSEDPPPRTGKAFVGRVLKTGLAAASDTFARVVADLQCNVCGGEPVTHKYLRHVSPRGVNEYLYVCAACKAKAPADKKWERVEENDNGGRQD